ncbi:MAG: NAD(P)/FAD-dependent oxidoreductase [Deltaproteobacteria bacterium]|nr:NAD(P)/FAD-dependent oxidoreductase [Deltaproteobacteria bacterium]
MNPYPLLFSPCQVGALELRNRLVVPAMHLNCTPYGTVTDQLVAFYRERAAGGAALCIVGGCVVGPEAGGPIFISLQKDDDIPGLTTLTQAIHQGGSLAGAQLYQAGAYAHGMLIGGQALSSSPHVSGFTKEECRAMTLEDIARVQDDFARAAVRAREAGFDMVEILGSAGYLICQFLSPKINSREDQYGGSLENRMRFGLEVVAKVRAAVGGDFAVGIRLAGNDFVPGSHTNQEARQMAQACEAAGVDLINVTGGWHESRVPQITAELPPAGFSYLARGIKRAVKQVPVAASNRIHSPGLGEAILARGDADLICMGRPLLADPELPSKARAGRTSLIRRCVACNQGCFDAIPKMQPVGCMVNPRAGREAQVPLPADRPLLKKVVVVGGGAAGGQAALTLAQRGSEVVLFETAPRLGGQLTWYPEPTGKPDFASIPGWQEAYLRELGVVLRLGEAATAAAVMALAPDHVIVATGGTPATPPFPGVDQPSVVQAWEVLQSGRPLAGPDVVVVGGGAVGLETALHVARQGALTPDQVYFLTLFGAEDREALSRLVADGSYRVTVLEMLPKVGQEIGRSTRWIVLGLLKRFGITVKTQARVLAVEPGQVRLAYHDAEETIPAATVILATGFSPVNRLAGELSAQGLAVTLVGDANQGGSVLAAIRQGFDAAMAL